MAQNFYPTAQGLIDAALGVIRAVDPESTTTPTTTQRTNALTALNYLVTSWQALGMQVWCTKNASLTLVASTNSYTVGPGGSLAIQRPLSIEDAWLHDTVNNSDPLHLRIIGREEYNQYTTKASTSVPYALYYDPQYDLPASNSGANAKGKIFIYPSPDTTSASTYTLSVVYTRPIQDFNAISDGLDFPQEWDHALKWNLAAEIAHDYGVPVMYIDRIEAKAEKSLKTVSGWDRESGSIFLQPESDS